MIILGKNKLQQFSGKHADTRSLVESWVSEVEDECWDTPHDLKQKYPKASVLGGQNVVFDIGGNRYRIWVKVEYKSRIVFVKEAGTHKEYDKWNIE